MKTHAKGEATFVLGKDGGAILVWLYPATGESPSLRKGNFTGMLAEGSLTAEKLAGPMKGKTPKDVFELLEYGKAGVAVHTEQNSGGELWGVAKQKGTGKTR